MTRSLRVQSTAQKEETENEKYLQGQYRDQRKQHRSRNIPYTEQFMHIKLIIL